MNIKLFPKIELHVHLDGSIRLETASHLLHKNIDEIKYEMIAPKKCKDLNEYLKKFTLPSELLQTKENLHRVSYELASDLKNDSVIYAEIRFAPMKHINGGLNLYEVVESVLTGLNRVDIKTNLILCMMRGMTVEENMKIVELAKHYLNKGVCGIDLAGAEALYKNEEYSILFEKAKEYNIPITIHSGEADGSESVKTAIELGAKRIGHGIRIIEDEKIVSLAEKNNIFFEVCPTSNIQTNVVEKYKNHPIKTMIENKLKLCVNTDNRTVSNTTIINEYQLIDNTFHFDENTWIKMNIDAIEASFISEEEKIKLKQKFYNLLGQ